MIEEKWKQILQNYDLPGICREITACGGGHINQTYRIVVDTEMGEKSYILQQINTGIFRDPEGLMQNIQDVTEYLRQQICLAGGDPERETLRMLRTRDGQLYQRDAEGGCWRIMSYVERAVCYEQADRPELLYQSGRGFGRFQRLLADYPADRLVETIPDFHHTPKRYERFCQVLQEDKLGRAVEVQQEIRFVRDRAERLQGIQRKKETGELPLRVTHNDTKLSNVMLDDRTGEAVCVIDLDTVMPGLSIFDYGDAIRFGANEAAEDEQDLRKVVLSLELVEAYTRGFLEECGESLTETEISCLPEGAWMMTMECGIRFLMDYLEGDTYYRISREGHNLDRARTQFALVTEMERKWDAMCEIVTKCVAESRSKR